MNTTRPQHCFRIQCKREHADEIEALLNPVFPNLKWMGTDLESKSFASDLEGPELTAEQKRTVESIDQSWYDWQTVYAYPVYNEEREQQDREARIAQLIQEGARYFVCEFTQNERPGFESDIYVRAVQPGEYTDRDKAERTAEVREKELYRLQDFNCRVVARLAENYEQASQGIFLDD